MMFWFTCLAVVLAIFIYLSPRILQGSNHDEEGQHHLHEARQIQEDVTHPPAQDALVDPALVDAPDQGDYQLEGDQDVEDQTRKWGKDLFVFIVCFIFTPIFLYVLYDFWIKRSEIMCKMDQTWTGKFQCQRYS